MSPPIGDVLCENMKTEHDRNPRFETLASFQSTCPLLDLIAQPTMLSLRRFLITCAHLKALTSTPFRVLAYSPRSSNTQIPLSWLNGSSTSYDRPIVLYNAICVLLQPILPSRSFHVASIYCAMSTMLVITQQHNFEIHMCNAITSMWQLSRLFVLSFNKHTFDQISKSLLSHPRTHSKSTFCT